MTSINWNIQERTRLKSRCLVWPAVYLVAFVDGMTLSWSTIIIPDVNETDSDNVNFTDSHILNATESRISLNADQIDMIVAIAGIGWLFGPIVTKLLFDKIGRKPLITMSVVPMVLSYILMCSCRCYVLMLIGRTLVGIGFGIAGSTLPLYIGEVSESKCRGRMVVLRSIFTISGILLTSIARFCLTSKGLNIACETLTLLSFFGTYFIAESPYFYMMNDDMEKATKSLTWWRRDVDLVAAELISIKEYVDDSKQRIPTCLDLFANRGNRRAFKILMLLSLIQFLSGGMGIAVYSVEIFDDSGCEMSIESMVALIMTVILVASSASAYAVDRYGRRPLVFIGSSIMLMSLMANGFFFTIKSYGFNVTYVSCLPFIAGTGYIGGVLLGFYSVQNVILSEYFSSNVKAKASMTFTILAALVGAISLTIFESLYDYLGPGTTFFVCCMPVGIIAIVLYKIMPETRGSSLQKINWLFNDDENNNSVMIICRDKMNNKVLPIQVQHVLTA